MKYLYWLTAFSILFASLLFASYKNGFLLHQVITDSMEPTMMIGDWLIDIPVLVSYTPEVGDVVNYSCITNECFEKSPFADDRGITHRITSIESNGCLHIVGDNPKYKYIWEKVPCYMPNEIEVSGVVHKLPF